jgi:DNA-binding transcriptional ArsR family regulator
MDDIFKALKDPTRRKILQLLKDGDMTAGEIAQAFSISKPSISHHLDLLKRADLITVERRGQFLHHKLNTTVVEGLLAWVIDLKDTPSTTAQKAPGHDE